MLQQDKPDDYVIATGLEYSVKQFVEGSAPYFGFDIEWFGEGMDEMEFQEADKNVRDLITEYQDKQDASVDIDSEIFEDDEE